MSVWVDECECRWWPEVSDHLGSIITSSCKPSHEGIGAHLGSSVRAVHALNYRQSLQPQLKIFEEIVDLILWVLATL